MAHLRWDLRQVLRVAVQEGHLLRNPAELLFIPRDAKRPEHTVMTLKEVQTCFAALQPRERLIAKLAILAGLRPGEIFGLQRGHLTPTHAEIWQRVHRGKIDSPKTNNSVRKAALAEGVIEDLREWKTLSRDSRKEAVLPKQRKRSKRSKTSASSSCHFRPFLIPSSGSLNRAAFLSAGGNPCHVQAATQESRIDRVRPD